MEISKTDYTKLLSFHQHFRTYHEVANSVYSMVNGHEYVSSDEQNKRRARERKLRDALTTEYGEVETIIVRLLGGLPQMRIPAIPGAQWDIFDTALGGDFGGSSKGQCLSMAEQSLGKAVGKAKAILASAPNNKEAGKVNRFSDELLQKVTDSKARKLMKEFNAVHHENPNAGALLLRTILLVVLRKKLGKKAKDDLGPVLAQAISQDVFDDPHIKRLLANLQGIPKVLLDATHHSTWMLIGSDDLNAWVPGTAKVIEATFGTAP